MSEEDFIDDADFNNGDDGDFIHDDDVDGFVNDDFQEYGNIIYVVRNTNNFFFFLVD